MKKYLVSFLAFMTLTSPCLAALPCLAGLSSDAVLLGKDTYLFEDSVITNKENNTVIAWIGYSDFATETIGEAKKSKSINMRLKFYCSSQKVRMMTLAYYSEKMFGGEIIEHHQDLSEVRALLPGTLLYDVSHILCKKYLSN